MLTPPIAGDVNLDPLVRLVSARFLQCKIIIKKICEKSSLKKLGFEEHVVGDTLISVSHQTSHGLGTPGASCPSQLPLGWLSGGQYSFSTY